MKGGLNSSRYRMVLLKVRAQFARILQEILREYCCKVTTSLQEFYNIRFLWTRIGKLMIFRQQLMVQERFLLVFDNAKQRKEIIIK